MNDLHALLQRLVELAQAGRIPCTSGAPDSHVTLAFPSPEAAQAFRRTLLAVIATREGIPGPQPGWSPEEWAAAKPRFDEKRSQCQALADAGEVAARHSLQSAFASLERRYKAGERTPALYRMMRVV